MKFGGGSLMMWGCMTSKGVGLACRIEGRMNAAYYTNILTNEFLATLAFRGLDHREVIFQQDNDPKHTSAAASNWFDLYEIPVLEWPSQSPDLNPIEHLWRHLKMELAKFEAEPRTIDELWDRVEKTWYGISVDVCLNLIDSMPARVSAVLKARGGYTRY